MVRKRIEESFGWIKALGGLAKTKLKSQAKLTGQALMCFAAYNPGAHGLHGWLVRCAPCVIQGRGSSKMVELE
jgi:hypothetical protein